MISRRFNRLYFNFYAERFWSNALFVLPNGAKRSPDMSWTKLERWNKLPEEERKSFPPLRGLRPA
jgi:Uma2 family endonuclease